MDCKNCNTALTPECDFCYSCGAKVIRKRLTIRNLFEHVSETFFNYDNKLLRTFINLFTKPEDVIGSYINGVRKKYVNPVSYFALAITFAGLQLYILNKFFPGVMNMGALEREETKEFNKNLYDFLQEYQTLVMMFYIPLYALISKIVFLNHKQFNYTEHLVIFLYAQAQVTIFGFFFILLLLLVKVPFVAISLVYTFLMFLYMAFVLKRMHNLTFLEITLKVLIFVLIFFVLFVIPIVAYGIYTGIKQASMGGG
ncbi:DUF3667 domain-containing protein [Flaviramulus sp. BrNp1-15]|uniref:DUF3667 domain-containing protein n=1 Tax=Flaviramulus sp. BrNp1-15 TaxID=2916754 RepID=UPI001EE982F1|nr:DUF3667 domain-containing protein [Flaviramulus sp. BrNp1-15]ULC58817.1 DUF3667 domain-containing protein [Flaviramulus sp. BrNp1-15]